MFVISLTEPVVCRPRFHSLNVNKESKNNDDDVCLHSNDKPVSFRFNEKDLIRGKENWRENLWSWKEPARCPGDGMMGSPVLIKHGPPSTTVTKNTKVKRRFGRSRSPREKNKIEKKFKASSSGDSCRRLWLERAKTFIFSPPPGTDLTTHFPSSLRRPRRRRRRWTSKCSTNGPKAESDNHRNRKKGNQQIQRQYQDEGKQTEPSLAGGQFSDPNTFGTAPSLERTENMYRFHFKSVLVGVFVNLSNGPKAFYSFATDTSDMWQPKKGYDYQSRDSYFGGWWLITSGSRKEAISILSVCGPLSFLDASLSK